MTLRAAAAADLDFVQALWSGPEQAMVCPPPASGEAAALAEAGDLMVWAPGDGAEGFAALTAWDLPGRVWGITALAVDRPGQGKGRAFLAALLHHVFAERGAHRLSLDVTSDNAAALALYLGAGFRIEGTLRECWLRPDGRHADCHFLGLLAQEWVPDFPTRPLAGPGHRP